MNSLVVSKYKLIEWLFLYPLALWACYFISQRDEGMRDYQNYLFMFNNHAEDVELSFRFLNEILSLYTDGFLYFLIFYAFLGFFLKVYFGYRFICKNQGYYLFLLLIFSYFFVFFTLWDLIQIRYSAGISLFLLAVFCKKSWIKVIFFILSILFHYSMILPVGLYVVFFYIERESLRLVSIPILIIFNIIALKLSIYSDRYTINSYNVESVPLLSAQYFFIFIMFFIFFIFRKMVNPIFKKEVNIIFLIAILMFFLMILTASYFPAIADRLLSITTFLFLLCLFFIEFKGYRLILTLFILVFSLWYFKIYIINPYGLLYNPY